MRVRTTVAAAVLTVAGSLPLAGTASAADLDCDDFPNQAAAPAVFVADASDPNRLDANSNGQACEGYTYAGVATPAPGRGQVSSRPVGEPRPGAARGWAGTAVLCSLLGNAALLGLTIPALGVTTRVMELGLDEDGAMEVPPGAYPAGWFDRSPTPGELGPAVLAGHVDRDGEPGVFSGLSTLTAGDQVLVDRADGSTATFVVERVGEYAKDEFPSLTVYGDIDRAGLRLITFGGDFDAGEGSYTDNVVVYARLSGAG